MEDRGAAHKAKYPDLPRSSHLLSRIFDIAEDAIISVNESHNIVMFNCGAEEIFGYRLAEVLGRPLDVLIPVRYGASHGRHIREFGDSPIAARRMGDRGQIEGRRKDGTEFPADASISKVDLEGVRIYSVILRDMTEHKAAEEMLKAALVEKEILVKEIHHRVEGVSQDVRRRLLDHEWPGNVRELRNAIERAMVLEESSVLQISSFDLNLASRLSPSRLQQIHKALPTCKA